MTLLPQSNARLVSISRGGFTEDYDRDAGSIPPIWQGSLDAYVQRKIVSSFNQDAEERRVLQVTLFLVDLPVQLEAGDVLTYLAGDPDEQQTFAGRVQIFTNPAYLPSLPNYYKIALEEVNVPTPVGGP